MSLEDESESRTSAQKKHFEVNEEVESLQSFIIQHEKVGKKLGCCHYCHYMYRIVPIGDLIFGSSETPIVSSGIYSTPSTQATRLAE